MIPSLSAPASTGSAASAWWQAGLRPPWPAVALILSSIWWVPILFLMAFDQWSGQAPVSGSQMVQVRIGYACTVLIGAVVGWIKEGKRKAALDSLHARKLALIESDQRSRRSVSDASEALVADTLLNLARELDPDAWLGNGLILRYSQSRPDQMSRFEVDSLLVTNFGLFLVEVKNWKHPVGISAEGWQVHKPHGRESVSSPLEQSAPKLRILRQLVGETGSGKPAMAAYSIVFMSHDQAAFPMQAPANVLYLSDLRYYLRTAYFRSDKTGRLSPEAVCQVLEKIASLHDDDPLAKHHFLLELVAKNKTALDYLEREQIRQFLLSRPPVTRRPFWRSWAAYVPVVLLLAGETLYLGPITAETLADEAAAANSVTTSSAAPAVSPGQPPIRHRWRH